MPKNALTTRQARVPYASPLGPPLNHIQNLESQIEYLLDHETTMHDTSFPPHRLCPKSRVSTAEALALVSGYLEKANHDYSLHPNAFLTERGPELLYSNANTGLVLHNLKRLQAGLKGEHLAAEVDLGKVAEDVTILANEPDVTAGKQADTKGEMHFEWQDLTEYEQEQQELDGEIGPETTGLGMVAEDEEVKVLEFSNTDQDRENRKLEKKRRKKDKRRQREEARMVDGSGE